MERTARSSPAWRQLERNNLPTSMLMSCKFLSLVALAFLATPPLNSAQKQAPAKSKPTAAPAEAASIEALTASALKSVVVIKYFGRDGKEDGVGAGFVISEDGLIATSLHVIGEARPISVQLADGHR